VTDVPQTPPVPLREVFTVPVIYGTAEHWLARAREAREMAAQMDDEVARQAMLAVAVVAKIVDLAKAGRTAETLRFFEASWPERRTVPPTAQLEPGQSGTIPVA
jgi:hypothetical protein